MHRYVTIEILRHVCLSATIQPVIVVCDDRNDDALFFVVHATLTTSLGVTGIWGLLVSRHAGLAVVFLLPLILFP
jgi:hypothetical protein